ncbi:MAG: VWA domain-containing protein, partial [Candidatus Rokuibacteriota bacterium]
MLVACAITSSLLAAAALAPPAWAQATGTIRGKVTENGGKTPMPFANIVLPTLKKGLQSGEDGTFVMPGVPAGTYEVRAMFIGRDNVTKTVVVPPGGVVEVNLDFGGEVVTTELEEFVITADRLIDTKSSSTRQQATGETLNDLPVQNVQEAVGLKAGVEATGGELHFRGGRGGSVASQPPVIPTTGGTKLPNDEAYDSMFFRNYGVNPFIATDEDALSTFAVDVDAASYTVTRRYLELGNLPPRDAVRVEEFVNFFPQGYPRFENEDFRILIDGAPSPFGSAGYHLLRIGLKGREIDERDRKPAYLTFVIDVSGSMERENRLGLVKQSLRLLVDQLRDDDRVGIVVYGSRGRVLLEPTSLGDSDALAGEYRRRADDLEEGRQADWRAGRRVILDAIELLRPEGSTNAEEGLLLGYDMARRTYWPGAINRLVLCSDGVANVGRTGAESILARVRSEADRGIHLSTIGFGMGNYN